MRHRILDTYTGPFALMMCDDGEVRTGWASHAEIRRQLKSSRLDPLILKNLAARLERYFEGESVDFADVPLPAGPAFYRRCWKACRKIDAGQTISYAELARLAGSPHAARAAGQAMRNNPQPIVTPCHRVIGSAGDLHGFGGSCNPSSDSIDIKRALLEMEQAAAVV
jgi:methylated-DNA-[protein]-cysteine S-methyltransferase